MFFQTPKCIFFHIYLETMLKYSTAQIFLHFALSIPIGSGFIGLCFEMGKRESNLPCKYLSFSIVLNNL